MRSREDFHFAARKQNDLRKALHEASARLRRGRAYREPLPVPGIFVVDQRLVKKVAVVFVVSKREPFQAHNFIVILRFVQNHPQSGADSAHALPDQTDGFCSKTFEYPEKFTFCFFRDRNFNHFLFLSFVPLTWSGIRRRRNFSHSRLP